MGIGASPGSIALNQAKVCSAAGALFEVRVLQNLVSARPWPSVASPHASSALRMQRRRTNRGRGPATEFVSNCWIGRRGGLEDRLKRRDDRCFGPAAVAHDPSPKGWPLLPGHRGHREGG